MTYKKLPDEQRPPNVSEDPIPNPFDPVMFVGDDEERRPATMAGMKIEEAHAVANTKPVKLKVRKPFRVVHDATAYIGGDIAEVPAAVADEWLAKQWAEPATTRTSKEK